MLDECLDSLDLSDTQAFVVIVCERSGDRFGGDTRVVTNIDMVSASVLMRAAAEHIEDE